MMKQVWFFIRQSFTWENVKGLRWVAPLLCLATMALFFLTMLQERKAVVEVRPLKGAYTVTDLAKPTFADIVSGAWQQNAEKYLRANHGFHEPAIRFYNQYVWDFYHLSTNNGVTLGKDNYLYEPYVVEDYYESCMYKTTDNPDELLARMDAEAQRLAKVQAILEECGTHLFVFCLPSKDRIYPQYLPDRGRLTRPQGPKAIEAYPPLFDRYGVHYINYCRYLESNKDQLPYHPVPQMGTHWSQIAATYAFDSVLRYMRPRTQRYIPEVLLSKPYWDKVRDPDDDLAQMLNLMRSPAPQREQYVDVSLPHLAKTTPEEAERPGLIVIGDSFFWNIVYAYPLESLFRYAHYWYYNSTIYFDEQYQNTDQVDLVDQLVDADFVMLSYSSAQMYSLGCNTLSGGQSFACQALVKLCYDEDAIQAVVDNLCQKIRSDESWYSQIKEKAAGQGRTVDEAVQADAVYLVYTQPEEFFPELNGNQIPTARCTKLRQLQGRTK